MTVLNAVLLQQVDCQQEPDWSLLLVHMQCSKTQQVMCTLAEKTGGDAFQLAPPQTASLELLRLSTPVKFLPQLRFESSILKVRALLPADVKHAQASFCTFADHPSCAQQGRGSRHESAWTRNLQIDDASILNMGYMELTNVRTRPQSSSH
jgi:hypothetical protein